MQARGFAWLGFALAIVVATIAIVRDAWPWISDDTFISLRYSERLLAGQGLTWNDGELVEGYSNLSWVLLTALAGLAGLDLIDAVRMLGVASTIGAFAVLSFGLLRGLPAAAQLATMLLAAQTTTALWAIGGLEAPLVMLCVGAGLFALVRALDTSDGLTQRRRLSAAGAAYGLLVVTRPDGPLWVVVAAVVLWLFRRRLHPAAGGATLRGAGLRVALPALLLFGAQTVFRRLYYGEWVANTTVAKLSPSGDALRYGYEYLADAAWSLRSLWGPALLGALLAWGSRLGRPLVVFSAIALPLWCAYVASIGGDYFPRNRVMVPTLLPLAGLAGVGFAVLAQRGGLGRVVAVVLGLATIGLARVDGERQPDVVVEPPLKNRMMLSWWEWQGVACGDWLRRAFADERPLLAMDQVGAVPYASKLPCVDMLGLCDHTIARTPIAAERRGTVGHARGNGAYVLARAPDLVLFMPPPHSPLPGYTSGEQMEQDPRFHRDYRLVLFAVDRFDAARCRVDDLVILGWVRLAGRIGCRAEAGGELRVPGYLLGSMRLSSSLRPLAAEDPGFTAWQATFLATWQHISSREAIGVLDDGSGAVVGEFRHAGEHALRALPLAAGSYVWRAMVPAGCELTVRGPAVRPDADGAFHLAQDGSIDIVLVVPANAALPVRLDAVTIERQ